MTVPNLFITASTDPDCGYYEAVLKHRQPGNFITLSFSQCEIPSTSTTTQKKFCTVQQQDSEPIPSLAATLSAPSSLDATIPTSKTVKPNVAAPSNDPIGAPPQPAPSIWSIGGNTEKSGLSPQQQPQPKPHGPQRLSQNVQSGRSTSSQEIPGITSALFHWFHSTASLITSLGFFECLLSYNRVWADYMKDLLYQRFAK